MPVLYQIFLCSVVLGITIGFQSLPQSKEHRSHTIWNDNNKRSGERFKKCSTFLQASANDDEEFSLIKRKELLDAIDTYNTNRKASWVQEIAGNDEKKPRGFFGAESRGAKTIVINDEAQKIVSLIEDIAQYNPTQIPVRGFQGYKEVQRSPESFGTVGLNEPSLGGTWKLRFTTAADATFKPGKRGPATTLQYVNATIGTFTNIIEFRENKGKVKGFRVVVEGTPVNDKRINLTFKRVIIDRRSRVGLNTIVIPLPNFKFLERFSRKKKSESDEGNENGEVGTKKKKEGPHFNMLYLDDEMRIHKTGDGNFFVQTRLYDAWDPMKGWTLISAV